MAPRGIKQDEVHLWIGRPDSISDPRLLRHFRKLLSQDERERLDRYHFAEDRHAGLLTRAMVRCLLSRYAAVTPSHWRFQTNQYGRPEIAEPEFANALRFNVAHTKGMIVVLISKEREVGVDVECLPYHGPCLQLASRFFSAAEVSVLRSLTPAERSLRFIQYWTLKEAFLKARGMGLAAPLNQFAFDIGEDSTKNIEINFDPSLTEDPERWHFRLDTIGENHVVATAIERNFDERIKTLHREMFSVMDPAQL